jgi:ABC-type amino acid transport substrate-binding protein
MKKWLILAFVLVPCFVPAAVSAETASKKITIAVKEFPPLVFRDFKGFCIDMARIICEKHDLVPEFVMYGSVPALLGAVESGDCDMGFAGITITAEREKIVDRRFFSTVFRLGPDDCGQK